MHFIVIVVIIVVVIAFFILWFANFTLTFTQFMSCITNGIDSLKALLCTLCTQCQTFRIRSISITTTIIIIITVYLKAIS